PGAWASDTGRLDPASCGTDSSPGRAAFRTSDTSPEQIRSRRGGKRNQRARRNHDGPSEINTALLILNFDERHAAHYYNIFGKLPLAQHSVAVEVPEEHESDRERQAEHAAAGIQRRTIWLYRLFRNPCWIEQSEPFRLLASFHVRSHSRRHLLVKQRAVIELRHFVVPSNRSHLLLPNRQVLDARLILRN